MLKITNDHFAEAVNELAQINVADCTGSCNEVKAAAQAWLDESHNGTGILEAETRLQSAAKAALAKDDACSHHRRDDLLHRVIV